MDEAVNILEARNVSKIFEGNIKAQALKGVNLSIKKGEFCSIIGPSGSGKSTLLHLLAALELPSRGDILIDARTTSSLKDNELTSLRQKYIGLVFQFHFLLPEFTALENLIIPQLFAKVPNDVAEKNALDLLEKVHLSNKKNNRPSQMSGGEQQRVAIARALVNKPLILLADEPTGNLDSENSKNIYQLLKALNKELNQTTVIVTHDNNFANHADRKIEIVDGLIVNDTYNY